MARTKMTTSHPRYFVLLDLHEMVISRCDEKGESLEAAIEAVIGNGRGPDFDELLSFCQG